MKLKDEYEAMRLIDTIIDMKRIIARHRPWFSREIHAHTMHPAVRKALDKYRPDRLHLLVLEWPHRAHSDPSRIAYTQNEAKGEANLQTVTSVGKYLRRHFSYMPDHEIRDIAALYAGHSYEIVRTMPEMLDILGQSPNSCMNNHNWDDVADHDHPYNVYDPKYGWALAYSKMGGKVTGRCLINDESMTFVRSYNDGASFSHSNEGIEMWLRENDYTKACDWDGLKIAYIIDHDKDRLLAPYLDGDMKTIRAEYDKGYCVITDHNPTHECESQYGTASEYHQCTCDDCGQGMDEDDSHPIGYHGDCHVGDCCIDAYTYVIGRGGNEYYVHHNDSVYVETQDRSYHDDYLDQNGIIYSDTDGEYYHRDDCVYLDDRSDWVHCDSEAAVYCENTGNHEHIDDCVRLHDDTYCLRDDATQCSVSHEWYADTEEIEWLYDRNGDAVHPDEADTLNESNMTTEGEA